MTCKVSLGFSSLGILDERSSNISTGAGSPSANSGVIVLEARSLKQASASCLALGEQLWSPELKTSSIQTNLNYLKYNEDADDFSQYWIASKSNISRAINANGLIAEVKSYLELPVLCTQSAPFSNESVKDTSEKWQVTVESNDEYLTGYDSLLCHS